MGRRFLPVWRRLKLMLVGVWWTSIATGQPESPQKNADRLFESARELMRAHRYKEACPLLEESQKLDPGVGTLLHLGECYEQSDRPGSAWHAFQLAAAQATQEKQIDRAKLAQRRSDALLPRLSWVTIEVPGGTTRPELRVTLDGVSVLSARWGTAMAVDPGHHRLEAREPDRRPYVLPFSSSEGKSLKISIPTLFPFGRTSPPPSPEPAPSRVSLQPRASSAPPPAKPAAPVPATESNPGLGAGRLVAVSTTLAAGTLAIGAGAVLGIRGLTRSENEQNEARSDRTWAAVLLGAGALSAGTGAVLWITAPKTSVSTAIGPGSLLVRGTF